MCSTDDESGDGQSTKSQDDVDSEVTFEEDPDEEINTIAIEGEDWIEHITTKKMKWKVALRIATSPCERWLKKAAEWNPELSSR